MSSIFLFATNLYEFRYSLYYCVFFSFCLRFLFQVMKILDFFFLYSELLTVKGYIIEKRMCFLVS